jgi:hypothetical protein
VYDFEIESPIRGSEAPASWKTNRFTSNRDSTKITILCGDLYQALSRDVGMWTLDV